MQLSLSIDQVHTSSGSTSVKPHYDPIHVSSSTFLAGLSEGVHRWFRLTPSYAPDLVRYVLKKLRVPADALIYDPFSGASTTSIECSFEGYNSVATEINPLLYFVSRVCLNWNLNVNDTEEALQNIIANYKKHESSLELRDIEANGFQIPPIHNPFRWWRQDVLTRILLLKDQ